MSGGRAAHASSILQDASTNFASRHGLSINVEGRPYKNGFPLTFDQKVSIGSAYLKARDDNHGARPNITALARQCKVDRGTITKIEKEMISEGRVKDPIEILRERERPTGPGSICLRDIDAFVIMMLYHQEPSMTLRGYVSGLYVHTGTLVCRQTIANFFDRGFEIRGKLCKPNLIPYDKFRPANLDKALEYLQTVAMFDRSKLKFGDEKHIKGAELWCRKTRRNVFSGVVPPITTHSDFRNTYTIIGFCGIDSRVTPTRYGIVEGNNVAENFAIQVQMAVESVFLLPYDALVLDNVPIHTGGVNSALEDWLWGNF